ncbi:MAG: AmmeMemoRadiSam system radical SAM enzyme [Dethiobacter sp.]|jgi:pyruvate formate lyase activating enzyme|nr:AmmeMemoRadiSam system radical SAM enzyme [Dethiobacter sp.]
MHEALFYEKKENGVHCHLCPHHCRLQSGETGLCGVRREESGRLYALNYGVCAAMATDPIEKKPLYHFFPGSDIFSIGTVGCNLDCGFCQNWQLARGHRQGENVPIVPDRIAAMLEKQKGPHNIGVAYTYSEPGMWYEFVSDTARLVRDKGFKNVLVTNGYLNIEPLKKLLPFLDALNIDVKAFSDEYYRQNCRGRLDPVLRYVETAAREAHVELTYLVVPTLNDSREEVRSFAAWVAAINPSIPVHFSRYYPQHRFTLPSTPVELMAELSKTAREHLHYVYIGNVPGSDSAHTYCPACGKAQAGRDGYRTRLLLCGDSCANCGRKSDFIMN